MTNIVKLTAPTTAVAIQTPVRLNKTPLAGGSGREAKYTINGAANDTAVVKLQGHKGWGKDKDNGKTDPPASNDAGWYDILTIDKDTTILKGEIDDLPQWIRTNCTALKASSAPVIVYLEGVQ